MEYPRVIRLPKNVHETLFSSSDFEILIDEYMGFDSRNYFHELIEEMSNKEDFYDEQ